MSMSIFVLVFVVTMPLASVSGVSWPWSRSAFICGRNMTLVGETLPLVYYPVLAL